jgi:multidrug efflux pump subunit AcrA (membrane-fusion protein)
MLLRIDPADYETRVAEAEAGLAEARADVAEAREAVTAAEIERRSAETQRALRAASLERQRDLAGRGVASGAAVEEAALALAAAEQSVASRGQAVVTAGLRVERAELAVRRAELALAEARRDLADTVIRAPFSGVVAEAAVGPGDLAAANGALGQMIDPDALEVTFHVTGAAFGRLLDGSSALRPLPVTVRLPMGDGALEATGRLDRPGAVAGAGGTGRTLFARLDPEPGQWLKPEDFVTVRLAEPPLADVAAVPATAVSTAGGLLLLGPDGRLDEVSATVLRREKDRVILADVPFGAVYVTERGPQLAAGVKARGREIPSAPSETVPLDPERRAALIAFVRGDETLSTDRRRRLLDELERPAPPRATVERLEARMAGG